VENFQRQRIDPNNLPRQVVEKWSSSVLEEGFVPFPKKLVRCLHKLFADEPTMQELAALLAVVDFKRPNLSRSPSTAYLAFLSGLDESEFKEALTRLEQKGFVSVSGNSDGLEVSLDKTLALIENQTT